MALVTTKSEGLLTTTAQSTIYAAPESPATRARLMKLTVTNLDTANAQAVSAWLVPSGGSAGNANRLLVAVAVDRADGQGLPLEVSAAQGHVLDPGDAIVLQAANANQLCWHLTVMQET
ncbi:MAG: hypothetical protein L6Q80_08010 [Dehalococcoidia bacterium]|nr:hypothetical protein [Dehalococcoidia bacterium]RIL02087.1 MAG: hypothetical protein DCC78_08415 [bacterium]